MGRTLLAIALSGVVASLAATLLFSGFGGNVGNIFWGWVVGASPFTLAGAAGLAGLAALLRLLGTPATVIDVILVLAGAIAGEAAGRVIGILPGLGALYGATTGLVLIIPRRLIGA